MKIEDLEKLRLKPATVAGHCVNALDLVVQDEFARKRHVFDKEEDYRERALDRIIGLRADFGSEFNTLVPLIERVLRPLCPSCKKALKFDSHAGGNSEGMSMHASCQACKLNMTFWFPHDAIHVEFDGGIK